MGNELREQGKSKKKISAFTWIFIFGALALAVIVPRLPMSTDQKLAIGLYLGFAIFGTPILIFVSSFLLFKKVISSYPKLYLWIAEGAFILAVSQMVPELEQIRAARTAADVAATQTAVSATQAAHLTAVSATQTAQPTFTQGPTSTATLLPKFAAATEDARLARDLASTETAFQAAQAATATYIGSFNLIDFRELRDYPANHIGEKVCLKGRVFNVNPPTEFQMYVGDTYDDAYIVTDTEFSKLYQDDLVYICGISADNKTFQNALGAQVSTPLIEHAFFR